MPRFRDTNTVAERLHNNPSQAAALLESVLNDQQIAALEFALFPVPTADARREALVAAQRVLLRAGLPQDDPALAAITAEIAALPNPVE
jgi:hypothetical protein